MPTEFDSVCQTILSNLSEITNTLGRVDERVISLERSNIAKDKSDDHLSIMLSRIDERVDNLIKRMDAMEKRQEKREEQSRKRTWQVVMAFIGAIIAGAGSWIYSLLKG